MLIAHLASLFLLAETVRRDEVESFEGHSTGLDLEHDLSLSWRLERGDAAIIEKIVEKVNPANRDSQWSWQDESSSWTFGAVKMLSGTAKESLALHMLHRHGLAPLLSAHSGEFAEHYQQSVAEELQKGDVASCCCKESADCASEEKIALVVKDKHYCCMARAGKFCDLFGGYQKRIEKLVSDSPTTCPRLPRGLLQMNSFISAEETSREVMELRALLHSLSLSGLRNLHSFDHQWSVRNGATFDGCSQRQPGGCPLQASFSAMTLAFLRDHGFGKDTVKSAMSSQKGLFATVILGMFNPFGSGVSKDFFTNFMQPGHTGRTAADKLKIVHGHVQGLLLWEGGGQSEVKVPVTKSQEAALAQLSGSEREAKLVELVEDWMEKQFASHKRFAEANRMKMWAAEEAEFFDLSQQVHAS